MLCDVFLISVIPTFALETVAKSDLIMLLGEISSNAQVDYDAVVRETVKAVGYDDPSKGLYFSDSFIKTEHFSLS